MPTRTEDDMREDDPETGLAETDDVKFRKALAALYPTLVSYARRITRNPAEAEDLVHDAIERGLRRQDLFRAGVPGGWMATILRHLFLDRCRRARRWKKIAPAWRRIRLEEAMAYYFGSGAGFDPLLLRRPSDAFDAEDIQRAVPLLKPALRQVFCMFAFERLSQRDIGRQLCLPVSTVGTRLMRARRNLRKLLEGTAGRRPPGPPRSPGDGSPAAALAA